MKKNEKKYQVRSRSLLDFIDKSPTPFHAVKTLKDQLKKAEYVELYEHEEWKISAGGQYFVVRNDSSLVAFSVGSKKPHDSGFKIIGAHTDSPNLRLKPNPVYVKNGYVQLGVEVYGGALLSTWTDRDLSLAGRVILKVTNEKSSKTVHDKLKTIPEDFCFDQGNKFLLSNNIELAIHLNLDGA